MTKKHAKSLSKQWVSTIWAAAWDFQQYGMCNQQQSLRSACAYAQSDQSLCWSHEYSMNIKLLTEQHLEFLSVKECCIGLSESVHVKMPHCWKSRVAAHFVLTDPSPFFHNFQVSSPTRYRQAAALVLHSIENLQRTNLTPARVLQRKPSTLTQAQGLLRQTITLTPAQVLQRKLTTLTLVQGLLRHTTTFVLYVWRAFVPGATWIDTH